MHRIQLTGLLIVLVAISACAQAQAPTPTVDPLAVLSDQLSKTQSQYTRATGDRDRLSAENTELNAELEKAKSELADIQSKYSQSEKSLASVRSQLSAYKCSGTPPTLQYGQVYNDSAILMAWVANQPWAERVSSSYRESVFSNTQTRIQAITYYDSSDHQLYVTKFLVFHDDPDYGTKNSILWIDAYGGGPCWLVK